MLENFHFIRPQWLFALLPLLWLAWRVWRPGGGVNPWRRVVDARLLPFMMSPGGTRGAARAALWLAALGWSVAVLALADPTWERKPQPVYQTNTARVIVLDLARSMDTADLSPSRMVRARYKVEDVLASHSEGLTGLVAYSGEAFTVTPLTRDVNTIRAMLSVLNPNIMPAPGNRADRGLLRAGALMRHAGVTDGQVLLIADGVEAGKEAASERAAAKLRREGYRVSVLGVGTVDGGPLTDAQGDIVRDARGKVVLTRLEIPVLRAIARAGGGEYRTISDNGASLQALLHDHPMLRTRVIAHAESKENGWKEQGPLIAALLLPLAALAFRRNWLLGLALVAFLGSQPHTAMASTWEDLWLRRDQQAARALAAADYAKAAALATDASRRGSAEYKRGDYRLALENFSRASGPNADYNRGNALARLGRYKEAIAAYDQALKRDPRDGDARANKAAVEALLKRRRRRAPPHAGRSQHGGGHGAAAGGAKRDAAGARHRGAPGKPSQQARGGHGGAASPAQASNAGKSGKAGNATGAGKKNGSGATAGRGPRRAAQAKKSGNEFAEAVKKLAQRKRQAGANAPLNRAAGTAAAPRAAAQAPRRRNAVSDAAQPLDSEERLAADEWLRRIPDDPGGLLRRKFLYEYRQRQLRREAGD